MPELLLSAKLAMEKGLAQGNYVKQLSDYIVPALVDALHKVLVRFGGFVLLNTGILCNSLAYSWFAGELYGNS